MNKLFIIVISKNYYIENKIFMNFYKYLIYKSM